VPEGFLDTNVLVYQMDTRDLKKRQRFRYLSTEDLNDGQAIRNARRRNSFNSG